MWTVRFLVIALVMTVFIRDAESWRRRRRGSCRPRACQVSLWSTWSPCTHLCGTTGTRTRARTVTVTPTCGGSCPHLSEIRSCNRDNCQNSGTPTINGCSCPLGYGGTCCEIAPSPVDGGWSEWTNWSPCPQCVFALRNRSRTCTNPAPAFGGQQCLGHSDEMTVCPENCPVVARSTPESRPTPTIPVTTQTPFISSSLPPCSPRACQVSSWSRWSPCTHQCGTSGKQTRTRTKTAFESCGGSCPHTSEMRLCNLDNCQNSGTPTSDRCFCPPGYSGTCCEIAPSPVDGGWSEWTNWSPCPQCVFALRNRSRTCTNPAPAFGGQQCLGHSDEITLCPENCPVSRPTSSPTPSPVAIFNTTESSALPPSLTVEPTSTGLTAVMSSSAVPPVTIPLHIQRILVDLLGTLTRIMQRLQAFLGGSLSPADFDNFRNETMQILRQAANQLLTPSSSRMSNIQMMKRAIPDFPNLQDVVQMLENIQRRLLD